MSAISRSRSTFKLPPTVIKQMEDQGFEPVAGLSPQRLLCASANGCVGTWPTNKGAVLVKVPAAKATADDLVCESYVTEQLASAVRLSHHPHHDMMMRFVAAGMIHVNGQDKEFAIEPKQRPSFTPAPCLVLSLVPDAVPIHRLQSVPMKRMESLFQVMHELWLSRGFTHNDLHCGNILSAKRGDGTVVLIDYGRSYLDTVTGTNVEGFARDHGIHQWFRRDVTSEWMKFIVPKDVRPQTLLRCHMTDIAGLVLQMMVAGANCSRFRNFPFAVITRGRPLKVTHLEVLKDFPRAFVWDTFLDGGAMWLWMIIIAMVEPGGWLEGVAFESDKSWVIEIENLMDRDGDAPFHTGGQLLPDVWEHADTNERVYKIVERLQAMDLVDWIYPGHNTSRPQHGGGATGVGTAAAARTWRRRAAVAGEEDDVIEFTGVEIDTSSPTLEQNARWAQKRANIEARGAMRPLRTSALRTSALRTSALRTSARRTSALRTSALRTSAARTTTARTTIATGGAPGRGAPAAPAQAQALFVRVLNGLAGAACRTAAGAIRRHPAHVDAAFNVLAVIAGVRDAALLSNVPGTWAPDPSLGLVVARPPAGSRVTATWVANASAMTSDEAAAALVARGAGAAREKGRRLGYLQPGGPPGGQRPDGAVVVRLVCGARRQVSDFGPQPVRVTPDVERGARRLQAQLDRLAKGVHPSMSVEVTVEPSP